MSDQHLENVDPALAPSPGSPYKFLQYYSLDDTDRFFGRKRETGTLLSDVIATRLVVLFARTGRGKTSLINAGVRPRLHELGYKTFYIRVEDDPTDSVRRALLDEGLIDANNADRDVASLLKGAADRTNRPVVVFFDQFEEFFIHFSESLDGDERISSFMNGIAELHRDHEAGVHIVFSMREDYFVELDRFRSAIPSIFQTESNLRLLGLEPRNARKAIVEPAAQLGVAVESDLCDQLLNDLGGGGRIEPARLQIVCDSLWRNRRGSTLTLADYHKLGGTDQILDHRLTEEVTHLGTDQLSVLEVLAPELRTERGTKYRREYGELVHRLTVDTELLDQLVGRLTTQRLVNSDTWRGVRYVEWTSDYLAERTDHLVDIARSVRLRRLLDSALRQARAAADAMGITVADIPPAADGTPIFLPRDLFEEISLHPGAIGEIDHAAYELLLMAALEHRSHLVEWFERARAGDGRGWDLLRGQIEHADFLGDRAVNAVLVLRDLPDPRALELLELALGDHVVGPVAAQCLAQLPPAGAIGVLTRALGGDESVVSRAVEVLKTIGTVDALQTLGSALRGPDPGVAIRAGVALTGLASGNATDDVRVDRARAVLDALDDDEELRLLDIALEHGVDARIWFDRAVTRGLDAWRVLDQAVDDSDRSPSRAKHAIRLVVDIPDPRADRILSRAAEKSGLAATADMVSSARHSLQEYQREGSRLGDHIHRQRTADLPEDVWMRLVRSIRTDQCVPVVGWDPEQRSDREIAHRWIAEYDIPDLVEPTIPSVVRYLETTFDGDFARELLARAIRGSDINRTQMTDLLARLPFNLYVNVSYDVILRDALRSIERVPVSHNLGFRRTLGGMKVVDPGGSQRNPDIFDVFGSADLPESLVVTEEDHLEWLVSTTRYESSRGARGLLRKAVTRDDVILLGTIIEGWEYRFLDAAFSSDTTKGGRFGVAVMPDTGASEQFVEYVERRLGNQGMHAYWGGVDSFLTELLERLGSDE